MVTRVGARGGGGGGSYYDDVRRLQPRLSPCVRYPCHQAHNNDKISSREMLIMYFSNSRSKF